MSTAGWLVPRFTWQHVMRSPAYVIATIRGALGVLRAIQAPLTSRRDLFLREPARHAEILGMSGRVGRRNGSASRRVCLQH